MAGKTHEVSLGKKGSFHVHKGALHRALGVPEDEKISPSKMAEAKRSSNPHVRAMARSAKGLKAMHHGGSRKSSRR